MRLARSFAVALGLLAAAVPCAAASAATVGGSLAGSAGGSVGCGGCVLLQVQPGPRVVATAGVITSWSADVAGAVGGLRLAVIAEPSPGTFRIERLGTGQTAAAGAGVQTVPDRVAVNAGEFAGILVPAGGGLATTLTTGIYLQGDVTTVGATFSSGANTGTMLRYEATTEPDADGDGYGDATQDACPAVPARQAAPCVDPPAPAGGNAAPPPAADTTRPALQNVVVSGGKVLFTATEGGSVTVRVTRLLQGRRRGKACVAPTPRLRRAKACTRRGPSSTTTTTVAAGAGSASLNRALLRKGSYEVSVVVRDAAGNASAPVVRRLSVKR